MPAPQSQSPLILSAILSTVPFAVPAPLPIRPSRLRSLSSVRSPTASFDASLGFIDIAAHGASPVFLLTPCPGARRHRNRQQKPNGSHADLGPPGPSSTGALFPPTATATPVRWTDAPRHFPQKRRRIMGEPAPVVAPLWPRPLSASNRPGKQQSGPGACHVRLLTLSAPTPWSSGLDGGPRPGGRSPARGHDGDGDRHPRALS